MTFNFTSLEINYLSLQKKLIPYMVRHVILWRLKESLSADSKENIKKDIKEGLEALKGKVPGIVDIRVNINGLPSSNAGVMLDSSFTDVESLKAYAVHPLHVAVAETKIKPFTELRTCLDFQAEE